MCWCFAVFFRIFGNLAARIFDNVRNAAYKMCCDCLCHRSRGGNLVVSTIYDTRYDRKLGITEPFYREVNREAAEKLLAGRQNGTFIIRPSSDAATIGILSVTQDNKIFHLVIRQREDALIALGREKLNEKSFKDLNSLINYYISNYLILFSGGVKNYTLLLPYLQP